MKLQHIIFISLIWWGTDCLSGHGQNTLKADSGPEKVTLCQLETDPGAYNHKRIEITAFVSKGFEDFMLFDPECSSTADSSESAELTNVWLEYGGKSVSGTMYCCGVTAARSRPKPLVIEKIPIRLIEDDLFREFDRLVQRPPEATAHATIIGRFFSGEKTILPGGTRYVGYGHMGFYSLLAIERIAAVGAQTQGDLDYHLSAAYPDLQPGCSEKSLKLEKAGKALIELQRQKEASLKETALDEPRQVAAAFLAGYKRLDKNQLVKELNQTAETPTRVAYTWQRIDEEDKKYLVVVNRPYWLSLYAADPKKTIWTIAAAFEISCD